MKKILVSGCGSLLGQGIIKTILSSKKNYTVFGTEYIGESVGLYWVKKGYILPDILKKKVSINSWYLKLLKIIKQHKINYLIPGLDFELPIFCKLKSKIEKNSNCKIIISNKKIINICKDKWKTVEFLRKNNFVYPRSCLPKNLKFFLKKNKFPLIVKPRIGSTSRNVFLVKNRKELKSALQKCSKPIIQEYLFKNNNEYTCGVIFDPNKNICLSSIVLNRKLKNGNTIKATLIKDEKSKKINKFIINVTKKIRPLGPLNFQLCLTKKGPTIFEINPRFSGTTPLRNIFGLNEIQVLLNSLENKRLNKIQLKTGTIYRYFNDYFLKKEIRYI
jgi:carbamoyl-phosphate synthase large subunit